MMILSRSLRRIWRPASRRRAAFVPGIVALGLWLCPQGPAQDGPALKFGPWEFEVEAGSGACRNLRWQGQIIAAEGLFSTAQISPDAPPGSPQPRPPARVFSLTAQTWEEKSGTLRLVKTMPNWSLVEEIQFGAPDRPDRLSRRAELVYLPAQKTAAPEKFGWVRFQTRLPLQGSYWCPATSLFNPRRQGECAALEPGFRANAVAGVGPLILQPAANRSLLFLTDARRDPANSRLERGAGGFLDLVQDINSAGWAEPGQTQRIGTVYLEVIPANREQALQKGVWRWYEDLGIKPPADRPDWVFQSPLYAFHPGGTIGSGCKDLGGFEAARETVIPRAQRLNMGAIWLLPIEDRSIYWPRDYYQFAEGLGTEANYLELVKAARQAGLKVWQDLVPHGGSPAFGQARGDLPWWLVFDAQGDAMNYWCFDFREPQWQQKIFAVADHYTRRFGIDGFRVDAAGGSHGMNWRRAGFPLADRVPANVPSDWWKKSLAEAGGKTPALPYERGSLTLREGGLQMLRGIRQATRRQQPASGAVLGEVQRPPYMQEADVVYDFELAHQCLPQMRRWPAAEFVPELQRWFEEQKFAEPRGTLRLRYVESHDTVRAQGWHGVDATRALLALTAWIHGQPMFYHDADLGHGPYVQRLLAIRQALPELQFGEAHYQKARSSHPAVFTCLREHEGQFSLAAINLGPEPLTTTLTLPAEVYSAFVDQPVAWRNLMNGTVVAEGKPEKLAAWKIALASYEPALFTLRPAAAAPPTMKVEAPPVIAANATPRSPPKLAEGGEFIEVKTGHYTLRARRESGLLESMTGQKGMVLLGAGDLLADLPAAAGRQFFTGARYQGEQAANMVTLRFQATLAGGGGLSLTYRCLPEQVEIEASLGSPEIARAGLVFYAPDCHSWQVNTAEGLLSDWFIPPRERGKTGTSSIYYRPQGTEALWLSGRQPLNSTNAFLQCRLPTGEGIEMAADPLAEGLAETAVLNRLGARAGWHAAFFWRDGVGNPRARRPTSAFTLRLRPLSAPPAATKPLLAPVLLSQQSAGPVVENRYYRLHLRRTGGMIRELWAMDPGPRLVAREGDLYTDRGWRGEQVRRAGAENDVETDVQAWRENGQLRLRFAGRLRDEGRFGLLQPPLRFNVEYAFDDSPSFSIRCSWMAEGQVRDASAFLAWVLQVPELAQFRFLKEGREIFRGPVEAGRRSGQTAPAGKPIPDHVMLADAKARTLLQITGLEFSAPAPMKNAFVDRQQLFFAWLDGPEQKVVPGIWHEAALTLTPGGGQPAAAVHPPWWGAATEAMDWIANPSFEMGEVRLASARTRGQLALAFLEAADSAGWTLPAAGEITDQHSWHGQRSLKVRNTTGEYLLATQPVKRPGLAGRKVRIGAWVRGENIVRGRESWMTGIVGFSCRTPDGRMHHPALSAPTGTYDWRRLEGTLDVPAQAESLTLRAGLNGATGTIWIDAIEILGWE